MSSFLRRWAHYSGMSDGGIVSSRMWRIIPSCHRSILGHLCSRLRQSRFVYLQKKRPVLLRRTGLLIPKPTNNNLMTHFFNPHRLSLSKRCSRRTATRLPTRFPRTIPRSGISEPPLPLRNRPGQRQTGFCARHFHALTCEADAFHLFWPLRPL